MERESWYEDDCVEYATKGRPMIPDYIIGSCYQQRGKTRYPIPYKRFRTIGLARAAANYILWHDGIDIQRCMEVVKCPYCGYYHIKKRVVNEEVREGDKKLQYKW